MTAYTVAITWKVLDELFTSLPDELIKCLTDPTGQVFVQRLLAQTAVPNEATVKISLKALETLAYKVTQAVQDDFEKILVTVRDATPLLRDIFGPGDAKRLILSFEAGKTPELSVPELIVGTYLVLKTGERDIPGFDVLTTIIELETPVIA